MSIFDENIVLKKYGRKRDEEIKRLGTIQAKLETDRKKLLADASGCYSCQIEDCFVMLNKVG